MQQGMRVGHQEERLGVGVPDAPAGHSTCAVSNCHRSRNGRPQARQETLQRVEWCALASAHHNSDGSSALVFEATATYSDPSKHVQQYTSRTQHSLQSAALTAHATPEHGCLALDTQHRRDIQAALGTLLRYLGQKEDGS
jgi:hypothetical protein